MGFRTLSRRRVNVVLFMCLAMVATTAASAAPGAITNFMGGGSAPVVERDLLVPLSAARDAVGNVYVSDGNNVFKYLAGADGIVTVADSRLHIAGSYKQGYLGDNGPARGARLDGASGVAVDASNNLYIADYNNHRIRKVVPGADGVLNGGSDEIITTIAGDGFKVTGPPACPPGDIYCEITGQPSYGDPSVLIACDPIFEFFGSCAAVGFGRYAGDGGPATAASLNFPSGVAVSGGTLYIADLYNHRIRAVDLASGTITSVAGNGCDPNQGPNHCAIGDGGSPTAASLNHPYGVSVDSGGNVLVVDTFNHRIRKITGGVINTVAGDGFKDTDPTSGSYLLGRYNGDGVTATAASLNLPRAVIENGGELFIADTFNQRVRKVDTLGVITTAAGDGTQAATPAAGAAAFGDGGPATAARVSNPSGLALTTGGLYIADQGTRRLRRVDAGTISSAAGNNRILGCCGDDGLFAAGQGVVLQPQSVVTTGNTTYISDTALNRVVKVVSGTVTTVAGTGFPTTSPPSPTPADLGDGGPAENATLSSPVGIALDPSGNLLIADFGNLRVRRVNTTTGIITTVAGNGTAGVAGDGVLATSAFLYYPTGVTADPAGNIYIAEFFGNKIRKVGTNDRISTVAGTGAMGFRGDSGPATAAELARPKSVVYHSNALYISDSLNNRIRKVDLTLGSIKTVAGNGAPFIQPTQNNIASSTGPLGMIGDNGPATAAGLGLSGGLEERGLSPTAAEVAFDSAGNMYIPDTWNHRIRKVAAGSDGVIAGDADEVISTIAGTGCYSLPPFYAYLSTQSQQNQRVPVTDPRFCGFQEAGNAKQVNLRYPTSVAMFGLADLLIADSNFSGQVGPGATIQSRVRRLGL